jgi:hypothetical protein
MNIEVSVGEIVDKLSILELKKLNIKDSDKLKNVTKEYDYLHNIVFNELKINQDDFLSLLNVNQTLWEVEDKIRNKEKIKAFNSEFVELARLVYITNDKRADLKKSINLKYNSTFVEEKSYSSY